MRAPYKGSRFRRTGAGLLTAAMAGGGLAAVSSAAPNAAMSAPSEQCQVVELPLPAGGYDGGVMDIEVVDGETVYYGSYHERDADGQEHQRVVIWRGLDGDPEPVDPGFGGWSDIALELTATGLINGVSEDVNFGSPIPWVIDLGTGEVTVVDTTPGKATDRSDMWVRRINDTGAVVGSDRL